MRLGDGRRAGTAGCAPASCKAPFRARRRPRLPATVQAAPGDGRCRPRPPAAPPQRLPSPFVRLRRGWASVRPGRTRRRPVGRAGALAREVFCRKHPLWFPRGQMADYLTWRFASPGNQTAYLRHRRGNQSGHLRHFSSKVCLKTLVWFPGGSGPSRATRKTCAHLVR